MRFSVKRGLDTPLKIQGMYLKYFYIWGAVSLLLVFLIVFQVMSASSVGSSTTLLDVLITLILCGAVFVGLKFYFVNISAKKKIPKKPRRIIQSNVDLLKYLK